MFLIAYIHFIDNCPCEYFTLLTGNEMSEIVFNGRK